MPPPPPLYPQDKSDPGSWSRAEELTVLPPESELEMQPLDKVRAAGGRGGWQGWVLAADGGGRGLGRARARPPSGCADAAPAPPPRVQFKAFFSPENISSMFK